MAQLVARGVWDAEAAGSSPVAPTIDKSTEICFDKRNRKSFCGFF